MSGWGVGEYYETCFAIERSRRYHAKMLAFYDWCHHLARAATALSGTASFFVVLAKDLGIAQWLTGIVAMAASVDSVFRFERKARLHDGLARRFTTLAKRIADWEANPANLRKARAARLEIEADEPPVRRLVDLQAYNEECRARGAKNVDLIPLSRPQRIFGYVVTFGMPHLERWQATRQQQRDAAATSRQQAIPAIPD